MEASRFVPPIACYSQGPYLFCFKKEKDKIVADLFNAALQPLKTLYVGLPLLHQSSKTYLRSLLQHSCAFLVQDDKVTLVIPELSGFIWSPFLFALARQMIKVLRAEILKTAGTYQGDLVCPITCDLFEDPVTDSCGHTFERSAIEKHLATQNTCPVSRRPIQSKSLNPVLALKNKAEKIRNKFPIPTPSSLEGNAIDKQPNKVKIYLATAKSLMEENEYEEVLEQYKKVLKHTNESVDYVLLPPFLEAQGKPLEAAYAFFCLSLLRWEEGKTAEAEHTLAKAFSLVPPSIASSYQAEYLELNQQKEKATALYCKLALSALVESKTEQAIQLYEKALRCTPDSLDLYTCLEPLYIDKRQKVQFYLSGLSHFGYKNRPKAGEFYEKALALAPDEPLVYLTYLSSLDKKKKTEELFKIYQKLATLQKDTLAQHLYYLRKLIAWQRSEDYQHYADALLAANKIAQAKKIYEEWTQNLLKEKQWQQAYETIQKAIEKTGASLTLLEQQYTSSQQLISKKQEKSAAFLLAKAHQQQGNLDKAKAIYTRIQEKFQDYRSAELLGDHFSKVDKAKSVKYYYVSSENAFLKEKFQKIGPVAQKAKSLDPHLSSLTKIEGTSFLMHSYVSNLHGEMQSTKKEMHLMGERLQVLEKERLQALEMKEKEEAIKKIAFGKAKWETYFGDIGQEPPLPPHIQQILAAPCPFWPSKKVEETHMLVLIPKTVNGQLLTLTSLRELIKSPKQGNATKFDTWDPGGNENLSVTSSYWVLMTRDVLEGTRNKPYSAQRQVVAQFCQKTSLNYQVPKLLEAATCILMEHVSKGTRLYSDSPYTCTRCEEKYETTDYQTLVGGFAGAGLVVRNSRGWVDDRCGLAGLRKF